MLKLKKGISLFMIIATIVTMCMFAMPVSAASASFPAINNKNYIETKAEVGMPVFLNEALTIRGTKAPWRWYNAWIDAGDIVRIIGICNSKAIILQYPTASGWRTGYASFANFFNYSPSEKFVATVNATVRAVPYDGAAYGTITSGDTVYRVGESNGHVLVIYQAKSGNRGYKLGYILESDYNRIKNHVSQTTLSNALYKSNVDASYTGVDYTKLTSDRNRIAALDKARAMVTVRWTAPCDFVTWCSSKGSYNQVVATDGTVSTTYIKGKTYIGVPYSMKNHSYDEQKWLEKLSDITTKSMAAAYYAHGNKGTALGIDCSYFVYACFKNTDIADYLQYQTTRSMLNSDDYARLESYDELKPADLLLKNGHVMLFVGKTANGKYAVFEATAEGSKCRYYEMSYSEIAQYKPYRFKGFDH